MKTILLIYPLIALMILSFPVYIAHGTPALKTCEYDSDLKLFTNKQEFTQGETILLNATTSSIDTSLEIIVKNPTGLEVFSDVIKLDQHGSTQIEIPLPDNAKNGTWKIFATTSSEQQVAFIGVGEQPQTQLSINPYSLNYPYNKEDAEFFIVAEPESYVYFRVMDPQGVQKPNYNTLAMTADGRCNYLLDLQGYKAGVYTVEISTEKEKASATFTVGIQPSVSPISIKTQLYSYHAGNAVLILGDVPSDVDVDIDVYDPDDELFTNLSASSDHNGKISTSFHLPEDAKLGTWKIKAISGSNFDVVEISVDGFDVFASQHTMSPLKQFNSGISFDEIQCKQNLVLLQKYDGSPACVTEQTKTKLIERGWTDSTMSTKSNECSTDMKEYPLSKPLSDVYANRLVLFMQPESTASFCVYYKSNLDNTGTRDITPTLYTGEILLEKYEGPKVSVDVEPKNVSLEHGTETFAKFTVTTTQNSTGVYHIGIPQLSRLPIVVWEDRQSVGANEIPVYSGFRSSGNIVLDAALLWHEEDDSLNYSVAEIRR